MAFGGAAKCIYMQLGENKLDFKCRSRRCPWNETFDLLCALCIISNQFNVVNIVAEANI